MQGIIEVLEQVHSESAALHRSPWEHRSVPVAMAMSKRASGEREAER